MTGLRPVTRIAFCKRPRGTQFRVELSARPAACAACSRARQFSLALLCSHLHLSSPPCSTRPTVTGWPRAGLNTRTPKVRPCAAFPPRGRFRVAQSLVREWGRRRHCSPQRPGTAAPAQLRARGYRGLLRRRAKHGPSGPDELDNRGWQPLHVLKLAGVALPVLAARRRTRCSERRSKRHAGPTSSIPTAMRCFTTKSCSPSRYRRQSCPCKSRSTGLTWAKRGSVSSLKPLS